MGEGAQDDERVSPVSISASQSPAGKRGQLVSLSASQLVSCEERVRDFRSIKVWEKAHHLALAVYAGTKTFPREEVYALTSQMRRSASSVPTNIAEGCGRTGDAELSRFCQIAFGSLNELEYQLLLSRDLGYLADSEYEPLRDATIEVKRMLAAFITTLRPN